MDLINSRLNLSEIMRSMLKIQQLGVSFFNDEMQMTNLWGYTKVRIEQHPEEASMRNIYVPVDENGQDVSGIYPLQAAMCLKNNLRVPYELVLKLIEAFPDALYSKTALGLTILHMSVDLDDLDITKHVLTRYPYAVQEPSNAGLLPIHLAKSDKIANLLLESFPSSVYARDTFGNLPLHIATHHQLYSHKVVKILLDKGIEMDHHDQNDTPYERVGGALTKHTFSYFPLQIVIDNAAKALTRKATQSEIQNCWEKLKACLWSVSICRGYHSGSLLHMCMASVTDDILLNYAIDCCLSEVSCRDACGRYPLHIAAMNKHVSGFIMERLLWEDRTAALSLDNDCKLPIHYACMNGRSFHNGLQQLVSASMLSLTIQNKKTNLFPFMMAAAADEGTVDTIFGLLRAEPNVLLSCLWGHF